MILKDGLRMLVIRNFRPSDLGRVYDIEKKSFTDPYHVLFLINLYDLYPDGFFVAEKNGIVVGYTISRKVEDFGHVLAIAVASEHRMQGIGKVLMERLVQHFNSQGAKKVWLEVRVSNKDAISFYEKIGFNKVKTIKEYYSDKEDAIMFEITFNEINT